MAKISWAENYPAKNHFHHPRNNGPGARCHYSLGAGERYIRAEVVCGDSVQTLSQDSPEPYQCDGILPRQPHGSLFLKCRLHFLAPDGAAGVVETESRETYSRKICEKCGAVGHIHNPKADKNELIFIECPTCYGKGEID